MLAHLNREGRVNRTPVAARPARTAAVVVALSTFLLVGVAWAGSSANYAIDWQVLNGGGASASGSGDVTLNGSLGQTAIGTSSAGGYSLGAGYWYGVGGEGQPVAPITSVYLPIILKGH
jgi:hypothetical protein